MIYLESFHVPAFQLRLGKPDELIESVERIKQGAGQYTLRDVSRFSNWIAINSFYYIGDLFEQKNGRPWTKEDAQNCGFYSLQCGRTSKVAFDLLHKVGGVDSTMCRTDKLCQNMFNHFSVLANFYAQEGTYSVLYDGAIKQFFNTDETGKLQDYDEDKKTDGILVANLVSTKQGKSLMMNLLANGVSMFGQEAGIAYLNAFTDTVKLNPRFLEKDMSTEEKFDTFKISVVPALLDDTYVPYTILPGDPGFKEQFNRLAVLQSRLDC